MFIKHFETERRGLAEDKPTPKTETDQGQTETKRKKLIRDKLRPKDRN